MTVILAFFTRTVFLAIVFATPKDNITMCYSKQGEGSGTPLQYSCLENPMDGGAWWAAVHGVDKCLLPHTLNLCTHLAEGKKKIPN